MTALLALFLALPAAAQRQSQPDPKALSSYSFDPSMPLAARIAPIPRFLLDAWRATDGAPQYQDYALTAEERKEFAAAVDGLPSKMRDVLRERVIGFYFVKNLKGNGITDWVLDGSTRAYTYTIFNPSAFKKTVSQVLTERERSPFKGSARVSVEAGSDNGIVYTVSHELAHAFDYARGLTPYTDPDSGKALGRAEAASWDVWKAYGTPAAPEDDYEGRSALHFYGFGEPELDAKDAPAVCARLAKSHFSSLYGSRTWAEDAAELFLAKHLTSDLKRPYRIKCGKTVVEPMKDPRIVERAARILAPLYGE